MDDFLENSKIDDFWEWFSAQEGHIRQVLNGHSQQDKEALVQSLDDKILRLGMFTWELGHGTSRSFYLTISPNGSRELLALSQEIMDYAPHLPHWEFYPAKQPQEWDLSFKLFDEEYIEREVDASSWKFYLDGTDRDQVSIVLEAGNIAHLDHETRETAANLVVTSLLGEEQKILYVREIEIISTKKTRGKAIQQLKQDFEAFLY